MPGLLSQERNTAGARPASQHLEQGEVLQRVGANLSLGGLDRLTLLAGNQFRADLSVQH